MSFPVTASECATTHGGAKKTHVGEESTAAKRRGRKPKSGDLTRVFRPFEDGQSSEKIGGRSRRRRGAPLKEQHIVIKDSIARVFHDACLSTIEAECLVGRLDADAVATETVCGILARIGVEGIVESWCCCFGYDDAEEAPTLRLLLILSDDYIKGDGAAAAEADKRAEATLRRSIRHAVIDGLYDAVCKAPDGDTRWRDGDCEQLADVRDAASSTTTMTSFGCCGVGDGLFYDAHPFDGFCEIEQLHPYAEEDRLVPCPDDVFPDDDDDEPSGLRSP